MPLPRFPRSLRAEGQPCRDEPERLQLAHCVEAAGDSDQGHCEWRLWSSAELSHDRGDPAGGRGGTGGGGGRGEEGERGVSQEL